MDNIASTATRKTLVPRRRTSFAKFFSLPLSHNMKLLTFIACVVVGLSGVLCDEQAAELSPEADIKKLSASESQVAEAVPESKSKDGDTLDASPSQQSQDYSYVVSKPGPVQPLSIDLGPYDSAVPSGGQQQHYSGESQSPQQPKSVVYRYTTNGEGSVVPTDHQNQQQSYVRTEPQHTFQSYVRQASLEEVPKPASSSGYRLPELPRTAPGVSTTFSSPNVKIVSHTRSFLPVVYNKQSEDGSDNNNNNNNNNNGNNNGGQQSSDEQEYDRAVQDRPGGNYAQEQSEQYGSDGQSDGEDNQRGRAQNSYENGNGNGYRQQEDRPPPGVGEVLSRGPYYNIHKPIAAHVQVIEDKDEYKSEEKDSSYERSPAYGLRTQPRQQYKNYKPSGYQPGMLSAYDPPSPPMSQFLPPMANNGEANNQEEADADDQESYNNRDLSVRPQHLPEPQALQHQRQPGQGGQGVEIEFDQKNQNEPEVVRGPGGYRRPDSFGSGPDQSGPYNQERPNEMTHDYDQNNHLGPKYNSEGDEPQGGEGHPRGRPQQQIKPQEIEYGFIPLSEAKDVLSPPFRGAEEQRRPNRPRPPRPPQPDQEQNGFGPEGYREQRGYAGPQRPRPQFSGPQDDMISLYGRGQSEEQQRPQFNEAPFREQPMRPMAAPMRKPQFERPVRFPKPGGQQNFQFGAEMPNSEEDVDDNDGDEGDYGKGKNNTTPVDNVGSGESELMGPYDPDKLPYECYPWNCNPWHAVHPNSPYNSPLGLSLKGRGPHSGSGLPPGASYNPRDVGLDEAVVAQLNLAASAPPGMAPGVGAIPPQIIPHSMRNNMMHAQAAPSHSHSGIDMPFSGSRPFPAASHGMPKPRPLPYSATGQGFRSQYGYRAAASEVSPVSAAQTSAAGAGNSPIANLLNLNPVKSFRSLMSYITGGING